MDPAAPDRWQEGEPYERYVGRWSRRVAPMFLQWLSMPPDSSWADIGCGTGALSAAILQGWQPRALVGLDASAGFLATARQRIADARAQFQQGDAAALPLPDAACDAAVSGLVLNFVGEPQRMVADMRRITRPGGCVAAYVWDYAKGMQMMRLFWDAALELLGDGAVPDEATRFPICAPQPLAAAWHDVGLQRVEVRDITIPTVFRDFEDFWSPFLGRQGAAPAFLASLPQAQQDAIRDRLERAVPRDAQGAIALSARAWAVKGWH